MTPGADRTAESAPVPRDRTTGPAGTAVDHGPAGGRAGGSGGPAAGPGKRGGAADQLRGFAAVWARTIHAAADTSLTLPEFEARLLPLAETLAGALRADPFDSAPGYGVGGDLVDVGCTEPETLPLVLGAVDTHLPPCLPSDPALPTERIRARCTRLQHALAAGFVRQLRERTRREQEAVARAAQAAQQARHEAEKALAASEAKFRAVFEGATIGVGIADLNGEVLVVNDAMARMFGGHEYFEQNRNVNEFVHPEDAPEFDGLHRELLSGQRDHFRIDKPYHRGDGSVLWTDLTVTLLRDASGAPQYQLALAKDITERRQLRERLRYQATHDTLTGLPNRALVLERLDQALATGSDPGGFGLCYLDLDGFKAVNDGFGHAVGERVLAAVAERLRACASGSDELVARMGGDEFLALATGPAGREGGVPLARRMLAALAEPVRVEDRELLVRGSIGVVDGRRIGELGRADVLRSADIAMYRAKAAGGNRYAVADADSDARAIARHALTNRLPEALDRGEFFIEYQPLVRLADGSVRGAEALVRWLHPVHGVLGPDQFIPLAESTGLIVPLGRWVLQESARQARLWADDAESDGAPPLRVNVNLSPCQLGHRTLVPDTVAVLKETGLDPSALCLEVTENALIGADEERLRPLYELADLGVDIALDDFGTGYSNLSYLRRLPVGTLKLDRSFTRGMQRPPADPVDVKIVEGVVSLAHALDLAVTVEGVETGLQAEHLRALGCDTAQGWYYARPGPPERLRTLALADAS